MADKRISQLKAQLPDPNAPLTPAAANEGFGSGVAGNLPASPTAKQVSDQRLAREDKATLQDYAGSIYRQDGLVDGAAAWLVERDLQPDPSFSAYEPTMWKELSEGINPEYQDALGQAQSYAHAQMIRERILQKQTDLLRLGDMGVPGNVARIGLNVVMPDALLAAMAGGWATRGFRAAELSLAASRAGKGINALEAVTAQRAALAAREASPAAIAGGIAAGGAGNAAFEKIRQSLNFEDSDTDVLVAGLLGAGLTAPFSLAGIKSQRRVAAAAAKEHEAVKILKDLDEGIPLTPQTSKVLEEVSTTHSIIRDMWAGKLSPEDARAKLDAVGPGPLLLGYDPTATNGPIEALRVDSRGNVAPSLEMGPARALLETVAAKRFPKDVDARLRFVEDELAKLAGSESPSAIKAKMKELRDAELAAVRARKEAIRLDNERVTAQAEKAAKRPKSQDEELDAAYEANLAAIGDTFDTPQELVSLAKGKVMKERRAKVAATVAEPKSPKALLKEAIKADVKTPDAGVEDLRAMVQGTDGQVKEPVAPQGPSEASAASATPPTAEPNRVAASAPQKASEGRYVEFTKRGKEDEFYAGVVESVSPEGFVKIRDEDGKLHTVHQSRIIENQEPPSGFLPGSVGSAQVAAIADPATQLTAMSKARLDIFATLNRSESNLVRKLAFDLVKDPIQVDDVSAQAMTASEHKSLIKRTVAGLFHRESREASNEAAKVRGVRLWQRGEFNHQFHSLVSRYTRGDMSIQVTDADILPMIRKASAAQKNVYSYLLQEAKKMGVKGAEDVQADAFYVNRLWNHQGIAEAIRLHGADEVHKLLATAINVPGYIGDVKKAAQFLGTVRKLEFSPVMQNIQLYAQDMGSLRKALTAEGKLSDSEVNTIVDMMFVAKAVEGKDAGQAAQLKYRFDLNETLSANTPAGKLRLSDLLENDARVLVDVYTNSMGGQIALAKKGFPSQAEFMAKVREVSEDALQHPDWDGQRLKRDITLLEDVYSNIAGKPMSTQDFSMTNRVASTLRGYTRGLMLGQLGLTAAFEMAQAVGYMGFKAAVTQMPSFRQVFFAVRNGYIPDAKLARDIEHMVGFGNEMAMSFARKTEIEDGGIGRFLTSMESGANKTSHAIDILSGNASMTSLTRQWAAMMATQEMHDFATGAKKLTDAQRARFVGHGLDLYEVDGVLEDLKLYSEASGHKLETIDYERWLRESPETYEKFQTALSRKVRDAIQDQDLGETMPFMHTTLGKVVAELKTFMLVAHAKNFLKNLHYRDATSAQVLMVSMVGNALAYMTQTSMNYAHDPEKLQEMLSPERIAQAIAARTAAFGVAPLVAEFGYGIASGGDTLLSAGSANTQNRTLMPPSGMVLQRALGAPSALTGLVVPGLTTTQTEARNLTGLIPNLYGVRNAANWFTNALPKSDPAMGP